MGNKSTTGSFFGDIVKATKAGGASSMTKTVKVKAGDTAVVDVGEDGKVKVLLGEKFEILQEG